MMHDEVGVGQRADGTMRALAVRRLAQQVTAEQQSGRHVVAFEMGGELITRERRFGSDADEITEPARLAVRGRPGQDEEFFELPQPLVEQLPVAPAGFDEPWQLAQL